jgi:hypothetical protein
MKERNIGTLVGVAAAIVSIVAGIYLLQSESASADTTASTP